ncbi:hypothetical protein U0070_026366, partial [Myodes glareolus]
MRALFRAVDQVFRQKGGQSEDARERQEAQCGKGAALMCVLSSDMSGHCFSVELLNCLMGAASSTEEPTCSVPGVVKTVDLVRQTGHQCGMSEKAIEKFIRRLLEKNEPQRGPPQYPLLLAIYKVLLTLGLIMFAAYFVIQPFSSLAPEPVLSGAHTWRSLIHHIRLMSLPITKKYMRETKGVPLQGGEEDKPFP